MFLNIKVKIDVLEFGIKVELYLICAQKYYNMAELNRIKVVLVEKKRTSKWLAQELGKSACSVSKWCTNASQPDLQTLSDIARLLEVDIKDLLNSTKVNNNSL